MASGAALDPAKWVQDHLDLYLRTGGHEGHLVDYSTMSAGYANTPTLLLRTTGRRSRQARITPLIYGRWKADFVIVASKGGAPEHPAWFLNLAADQDVRFQAACEKFTARAQVSAGSDRAKIWSYMAELFPSYLDYQKSTEREIPIVLLTPTAKIDRLD